MVTSTMKRRVLGAIAQVIGVSALWACGGVPNDVTVLEAALEEATPAEQPALELPFVDGDVAPGEDAAPTLLGPNGESMLADDGDVELEKIFTLSNPDGSRSRQRGAITIKFNATQEICSGSIVNNGIIITAAHCLPEPNRNRFHDVTITYQPPIDPNAPFCPDCGPDLTWNFGISGVDRRMFFYPHPNQTAANDDDIDAEWDLAIGAICSAGSDCDEFNTTQSLGLGTAHFVTLSLRVLADNMGLTLHGYGAPEIGVQHRMSIRVDDAHADYIDWEYVLPLEWVCQGDSGGPTFRNSGYSDGLGRYWQAQAAVMRSVDTNAHIGGVNCGDTGKASNIRKKTAWIASNVAFWTSRRCQQFTNPAGEAALWCWAI